MNCNKSTDYYHVKTEKLPIMPMSKAQLFNKQLASTFGKKKIKTTKPNNALIKRIVHVLGQGEVPLN